MKGQMAHAESLSRKGGEQRLTFTVVICKQDDSNVLGLQNIHQMWSRQHLVYLPGRLSTLTCRAENQSVPAGIFWFPTKRLLPA